MIRAMSPVEVKVCARTIGYDPTSQCRGITNGRSSVLLDHWTPNSVHMHMYLVPGRISSDFCREVFGYIFQKCGRSLVIGNTPGHNTAALRFSSAMGLIQKYRIKDGWAIGDDLVISELRKEDCKFLRKVHVKEHPCPT